MQTAGYQSRRHPTPHPRVIRSTQHFVTTNATEVRLLHGEETTETESHWKHPGQVLAGQDGSSQWRSQTHACPPARRQQPQSPNLKCWQKILLYRPSRYFDELWWSLIVSRQLKNASVDNVSWKSQSKDGAWEVSKKLNKLRKLTLITWSHEQNVWKCRDWYLVCWTRQKLNYGQKE